MKWKVIGRPKNPDSQEGFNVGALSEACVGLIGFTSVGKLTLLQKSKSKFSEATDYEFTTLKGLGQ